MEKKEKNDSVELKIEKSEPIKDSESHEESESEEKVELKFCVKKRYHNKKSLIFLLIIMSLTFIIFGFGIKKYFTEGLPESMEDDGGLFETENVEDSILSKYNDNPMFEQFEFINSITSGDVVEDLSMFDGGIILYAVGTLTQLAMTTVYLIFVLLFSGFMVILSFILVFVAISVILIYFAFMIRYNSIILCIISIDCVVIFAVIFMKKLYDWREGIEFSKYYLKISVKILKKIPSLMFFSFVSIVVAALINQFFLICFCVINMNMDDMEIDDTKVSDLTNSFVDFSNFDLKKIVISVFLLFSYLFSTNLYSYIVNATVSGAYAIYVFSFIDNVRYYRSILFAALRRSLTTSLGSICLGSMVLAVLDKFSFLKYPLQIFEVKDKVSEEMVPLFDWLEENSNDFTFSLITIVDEPFFEASEIVSQIMQTGDNDEENELRDCVLSKLLSIGKIIVIMTGVILTGVLAIIFNISLASIILFIGTSYKTGDSIFSCVENLINSSINTLFICNCGVEGCLDKIIGSKKDDLEDKAKK